ncbi:putative phospholipid-binding protein [Pseudogulbenkiania sp. NH8B]|uniref:Transport-associated protein n=1 Tax=Pseudogulbenkiania ferrooxidans 2002 TaxID=279714 RepID=B9YYE2_9NEIS|nr:MULTISPECIES: BON domain-containing protein [Pseudogulbenkiania]EEG10145.1 transport-associated protein [Pseudogulbenkiania ferrooxidans 2002]BAK78551.1 putative phospholipid-binding protein [Pseudogulbenkiania sp. NH8B]
MRRKLVLLASVALLSVGMSACVPLVVGGAAAGAAVATDRRTSGAYIDDQAIELKASDQVNAKLPSAHVNIASYNRAVLMSGEVPSEAAREQAELIVRGTPNVRKVYNHTVVAGSSALSERNNDTWITTKVRTRLFDGKGFSPQTIKIVTERGVVYMMGLVTQAEGEAAAKVVSQTSGVQKVVTLFEYISEVQP